VCLLSYLFTWHTHLFTDSNCTYQKHGVDHFRPTVYRRISYSIVLSSHCFPLGLQMAVNAAINAEYINCD